jgi:hypothetical protein
MEVRKNRASDAATIQELSEAVARRMNTIDVRIKLCMRNGKLCCDSEGFRL